MVRPITKETISPEILISFNLSRDLILTFSPLIDTLKGVVPLGNPHCKLRSVKNPSQSPSVFDAVFWDDFTSFLGEGISLEVSVFFTRAKERSE